MHTCDTVSFVLCSPAGYAHCETYRCRRISHVGRLPTARLTQPRNLDLDLDAEEKAYLLMGRGLGRGRNVSTVYFVGRGETTENGYPCAGPVADVPARTSPTYR